MDGCNDGHERRPRRLAHVAGAQEGVDEPGFIADLSRNTRRLEARGVSPAIVVQGVETGGHQEGGRQAVVIGFAQGLGKLVSTSLVGIAVIDDIAGRKPRCMGLRHIGAASHVAAESGIDQHLARKLRSALVAGLERQRRRKIAASTVTAHHDARVIFSQMLKYGPAIVEGGGEGVFRRQAVPHRHDIDRGTFADFGTDIVVTLKPAQHIAAAMEVK